MAAHQRQSHLSATNSPSRKLDWLAYSIESIGVCGGKDSQSPGADAGGCLCPPKLPGCRRGGGGPLGRAQRCETHAMAKAASECGGNVVLAVSGGVESLLSTPWSICCIVIPVPKLWIFVHHRCICYAHLCTAGGRGEGEAHAVHRVHAIRGLC